VLAAIEVGHIPLTGMTEARTVFEQHANEASAVKTELRRKTEFWSNMSIEIPR